jgi:phospholipase C
MPRLRSFNLLLLILALTACVVPPTMTPTVPPAPAVTLASSETPLPVSTLAPPDAAFPTGTPKPLIPGFDHIVWIIFENKEFGSVIGNPQMPVFNRLAQEYTLLTQYYAVTHPSLPNYIALIGGDTFGIDTNCNNCFVNAPNLPDLIENSGRAWKTYQEDMPSPCFSGDTHIYVQKHNPFMYFDNIRLDAARCEGSVVPLTALQTDIEAGALPNFLFIKPNLCNDSHDCELDISDAWLANLLTLLVPALDARTTSYAIFIFFEEGQGNHSCCGLPEEAGGRVPMLIYSPLARNGFEDATQYTHYSLLKTVLTAWSLPYIGRTLEANHVNIVLPWK